jgi:hypothetical protein
MRSPESIIYTALSGLLLTDDETPVALPQAFAFRPFGALIVFSNSF